MSEFRVVDRRRFNPDGTPREPAAEQPSPPPREEAARPESRAAAPPPPPATFPALATLLAELSLGCLSRQGRDLARAKFYIDLLGVLRDKTQGNLTPQESSLLEELLFQLRLRYLEEVKGG